MEELVTSHSVKIDVLGICIYLGFLVLTILAVVAAYFKTQVSPAAFDNPLFGAIRLAAVKGDIKTLQKLSFSPRFDVNAPLQQFTALHAAACGGQRDAALWLLQRGADVDIIKNDGWNNTALHYAASRGSIGVCDVLLAYGADIEAIDAFGFTPEMIARKRRYIELADYLASIIAKRTAYPCPELLQAYDALLAPPLPEPWHEKFKNGKLGISMDLERGDVPPTGQAFCEKEEEAWKTASARGHDGIGTEGTVPKEGLKRFRILAVCMQTTCFFYLFYRAGWTFVPGKLYAYSVLVFLMEYIFFAFSFIFIISMWNQIERPSRWVSDMLLPQDLPHVDVYIMRYNEPIDLLEPTVVAALNINWPGDKLTVHVLDDSQGKEVLRMVKRLRFQLRCMQRKARLVAVTRRKSRLVPHHAKAGNITHAILNSQGKGEFILLLDLDMIPHPDILQRLIGHFYRQKKKSENLDKASISTKNAPSSSTASSDRVDVGDWERKPRTALLQTPQDFYNVPAGDPFVHSARFFYGPMLQGRDGLDCSPCCGTGAIFCRDALVSIGGQSFGSITEDYNTSKTLFACGFSSMFVNERLCYGLAPEFIADVFTQRQRWAMGAIQMLFKPNNHGQYGLTYLQNLIFFDFSTYHFLAIPTVFMYTIPFIFIVFEISPIQVHNIWIFCLSFAVYFGFNRGMHWWAHHSPDADESAEMWRGWQMWLWLAPSHIKAILRVAFTHGPLGIFGKCFGVKPITFVVTEKSLAANAGKSDELGGTEAKIKEKKGDRKSAKELFLRNFSATWYFLVFYALFIGCTGYSIYRAAANQLNVWLGAVYIVNLLWSGLAAWCLWPPLAALLPRVETDNGWKVQWHAFLPRGKPIGSIEPLDEEQGTVLQRKPSMAARLVKAMSTHLSTFSSKKLSTDPVAEQMQRQASRAESRAVDVAAYSNIGRLAQPMRSAKSLAKSALLTGTILPERDDHSFAASRKSSNVLVLPDGRLAPAPSIGVSSAHISPRIQSEGQSPRQSPLSTAEGISNSLGGRSCIAHSPFLATDPSGKTKALRADSLAKRLERLTGDTSIGQVAILPPGSDLVAKREEDVISNDSSEEFYSFCSLTSDSVPIELSLADGDLPPPSKPCSSKPKIENAVQEEKEEDLSFALPSAIHRKTSRRKGVSFKLPSGHNNDGGSGGVRPAPASPSSLTSPTSPNSKAFRKKAVSFKLAPGADVGDDHESPALETSTVPLSRRGSVRPPKEQQPQRSPITKTSADFDIVADHLVAEMGREEDDDEDALVSLSPFAAEASIPFTFEHDGEGDQEQDSIMTSLAPNAVAHSGRTHSRANSIAIQCGKSVKKLQMASSRRATSLPLAEKRARAASRYLLDWTPSITGDGGASVLLSGGSMMVPIVPTTIFEYSIAAKPFFEGRQKPRHSNSYLIASVSIELGMITVAILGTLFSRPLVDLAE